MKIEISSTTLASAIIKMGLIRKLARKSSKKVMKRDIGPHVVENSRLNAPIMTGALRRSIKAEEPRIQNNEVTMRVGSGLPYALQRHEEPFTLGPISSQQPDTPEGGVGHKYIERVVNAHAATTYVAMLGNDFGVEVTKIMKTKERK